MAEGRLMPKPHLGAISDWRFSIAKKGFVVFGVFDEASKKAKHAMYGHTSRVLFHNEATGEIETLNSRYTLTTPAALSRSQTG